MSILSSRRAILLDFDGVILDSETLQARAWSQLASELACPAEITLAQIAGRLDRHIAPDLFPSRDPSHCVTRKQSIERQLESLAGPTPIPDTLEFIRKISATHTLAVVSSSRPNRIHDVLSLFDIRSHITFIVGQTSDIQCKPSPAPYLKALELLNLSPDDAFAIEDSPTGLTASTSAKLYSIQLVHPSLPKSLLANQHIYSCSELLPSGSSR